MMFFRPVDSFELRGHGTVFTGRVTEDERVLNGFVGREFSLFGDRYRVKGIERIKIMRQIAEIGDPIGVLVERLEPARELSR